MQELSETIRDGDEYVKSVLGGESRKRGRWECQDWEAEMLFCIVSKGRPGNVLQAEARLLSGGARTSSIVWIVGRGDRLAYESAGGACQVLEGGGLCASRNLAIDEARRRQYEYAVQLSDDLRKVDVVRAGPELRHFFDESTWKAPGDFSAANAAAKSFGTSPVSPVAAARLVRAVMRQIGAKLGGCYPTPNQGQAMSAPPLQRSHFVVGDFVVIDAASPLRFDERFLLKEDYDFTAQHLHHYGLVARCNRVVAEFVHRTNSGGAVDIRDDQTEKDMIALLHHKWPGTFRPSTKPNKRDVEVTLRWSERSSEIGGRRRIDRPPLPSRFFNDRKLGEDDYPHHPRRRRRKLKARKAILVEMIAREQRDLAALEANRLADADDWLGEF